MTIYYQDDYVTLYHGDCLEETEWLSADVLVTDPPYGIGWDKSDYLRPGTDGVRSIPNPGIQGDKDTVARDAALQIWGAEKPAVMFGVPRIPAPAGTRDYLIYQKPSDTGFYGSTAGYRRDYEEIYLINQWPKLTPRWSSIIKTNVRSINSITAARYPGDTGTGHPHTKPLDVMRTLVKRSPEGIIADPFAGSGSTLVAARDLGRKAIGVELEEKYCEIIASRLSQGAFDFAAMLD